MQKTVRAQIRPVKKKHLQTTPAAIDGELIRTSYKGICTSAFFLT